MSAFQYSVDDLSPSKASAKRLSDAAADAASSPGAGGAPRSAEEQDLIKDTAVACGPLVVAACAALVQDAEAAAAGKPHKDADGNELAARVPAIDIRIVGEITDGEHVRVNLYLSGGLIVVPET